MTAMDSEYPVRLEIDPAAPQGRLTILFRVILAIPHSIILYFLGIAVTIVGILAWFAIVLLGRFPQSLLRFTIGYNHWSARVNAYSSLLTSRYPPFSMDQEGDYPVRLFVVEQVEGRNRLTTFFRLILIIPHAIVLSFLGIIVGFVLIAAWLVGLVLGRVPEGLHEFLVGITRWNTRVNAYGGLLVDEYPPFSFS